MSERYKRDIRWNGTDPEHAQMSGPSRTEATADDFCNVASAFMSCDVATCGGASCDDPQCYSTMGCQQPNPEQTGECAEK